MNEQLPDGLRLAIQYCNIGSTQDRRNFAENAIRDEHAQRLTLQRHAADQAQRIADLETKCATLKRLHDAAADERDEARSMFYAACQSSAAFAVALGMDETENDPPNIADAIEELVAERDALRSANAHLHSQVAYWHRKAVETRNEGREIESHLSGRLDVVGNELRSVMAERDALRARLAEIEAQEPVAWEMWARKKPTDRCLSFGSAIPAGMASRGYVSRPLYARPVPAQAVPESVDGLVSVFSYDEVLTFTFRAESDADKFMARFEPTVDSASREHKA